MMTCNAGHDLSVHGLVYMRRDIADEGERIRCRECRRLYLIGWRARNKAVGCCATCGRALTSNGVKMRCLHCKIRRFGSNSKEQP